MIKFRDIDGGVVFLPTDIAVTIRVSADDEASSLVLVSNDAWNVDKQVALDLITRLTDDCTYFNLVDEEDN